MEGKEPAAPGDEFRQIAAAILGQAERPFFPMRRVFVAGQHAPAQGVDGEQAELAAGERGEAALDILRDLGDDVDLAKEIGQRLRGIGKGMADPAAQDEVAHHPVSSAPSAPCAASGASS